MSGGHMARKTGERGRRWYFWIWVITSIFILVALLAGLGYTESKDLIHALNHIFAHFMCGKEGKADLAVELSGKKRYLTASVRSGLKSFSFDTWPIALLTPSSSDGMRSYKVKSGLGFYELLRTAYFTVFSFVLANLGDFLQFHAGAVAKGEAGIIFPGGSGSGKTTLVLALTRAGYSFLSDEVCLIDFNEAFFLACDEDVSAVSANFKV